MSRLVDNQRNEVRGYNYRTGEVLQHEVDWKTKRELQKVGGRQDRQVPIHMKKQAVELLLMDEYSGGLELQDFLEAYSNEFGYLVEFHQYGFFNFEDFFGNGLEDWVKLKLQSNCCWKVMPVTSSEIENSDDLLIKETSIASKVPLEVKGNFQALLACRPQGMEVSALPMIYSQFGDLHPVQLGFSDMLELCLFMPEVCSLQLDLPEGQEKVLPPPVLKEEGAMLLHPTQSSNGVLDWVVTNIKRVMVANLCGVLTMDFHQYHKYFETIGDYLDVKKTSSSLKTLLRSLENKVVNVDFPRPKERVNIHKSCKKFLHPGRIRKKVGSVQGDSEAWLG